MVTDVSPVRAWHRWVARRFLSLAGNPPLAVSFWDGSELPSAAAAPVATLKVHDAHTMWRVIRNPFIQFGEAYADGRLDVMGDLAETLVAINRALRLSKSANLAYDVVTRLLRLPRFNSLSASRQNVHHHYDIGNDFYRLWLDERLAYTCAYFPHEDASLEEAQLAKFDHVCRKLRLAPGEHVVEAGSGWGSFALHMARHYGVTVQAYNVSGEQVAYARERARAEGFVDRVTFVEDDWRNIAGKYDVFVSIGMLEHVGKANYGRLGQVIDRVLAADGRGLIHSIGRNSPAPVDPWIERRIFPGSYAPSLGEMMKVFQPREFSVLDVENLRLHYARTLRHWLTRFERAKEQITAMFDERFVRMWRLYLAGSIAGFETGALQLFQVLFARRDLNEIAMTRGHLYPAESPIPCVAQANGAGA
jgi:cyclopropane-fatty-acyl-phospholipid synthase